MKENVVKLLKEQLWHLGTYSDEPNTVPVAFKDVTADGRLIVGDVFLETTLSNIRTNGRVAVSACDNATREGYQIKGTAEYVTEGPAVDTLKKLVSDISKGRLITRGALIITPEKVIVTTPNADNKKVI